MITLETIGPLAPGPAATGVDCLPANNNLDLARFADRLWFVWRTAPTHFASTDARLEIASAPGPEGPWRHEHTVSVGADLREPRLVVAGDRLHLFFMELGTDPKRFEPRGMHRTSTDGETWAAPQLVLDEPGVVPWRIRRIRDRWALIGYRGADRLYVARPSDPVVEVRWSDDILRWSSPVDVHVGGTEFELLELPDGRLLGVSRNEGPTRRGGDLLVGLDLDHLAATPVPRKPDSPNLFLWHDQPFLLARRQVAFGGRYDHVPPWTPGAIAIRIDQALWSLSRKRSALYLVEPDGRSGPELTWMLDLPSRGDTAFAAVVAEPDGSLLVADYSSPPAGGDVMWVRGQLRPTEITLHRLRR